MHDRRTIIPVYNSTIQRSNGRYLRSINQISMLKFLFLRTCALTKRSRRSITFSRVDIYISVPICRTFVLDICILPFGSVKPFLLNYRMIFPNQNIKY